MRSRTVFLLLGQVFLLVERSHSKFLEHFKYKILANDGSRNQCKLKYLDFPCKYREASEARPTKWVKSRLLVRQSVTFANITAGLFQCQQITPGWYFHSGRSRRQRHRLHRFHRDFSQENVWNYLAISGADAPNLFHTRSQYRGVSFAIGGLESWRSVTTLPNILKVFNPNIVGGSVNVGGEFERGTNLNLARYLWPAPA